MKKLFIIILVLSFYTSLHSQEKETIKLNPHSKDRGKTVIKALSQRASVKEFDTTRISLQDMSDLIWAANGINRPETGMRTASSAMNSQDIDLFIFKETGVYIYNPSQHSIELVANGDNRKIFSREETNNYPPIIFLLVSDISRFSRGEYSQKLEWAAIDAGIVAQNILLFATSIDMVGRPRAGMNKELIKELLNLNETQFPLLNIPVSY